jgi:hypothetical protein
MEVIMGVFLSIIRMHRKNLSFLLAFVVVFVVGFAIGYAVKPSIDVRVCDQAQLRPVPPMFDPHNASLKQLAKTPVIGPIVNGLKNWQPLGAIGSFAVYVNPNTGDYLIGEDNCRGAVLMQQIANGRTELSMLDKRQEIWVTLAYDNTTRKRIRSTFQANAEGGLLAPTKWVYADDNGDGRFDKMVDCEKGVGYEQKGLEWIEFPGVRSPDEAIPKR